MNLSLLTAMLARWARPFRGTTPGFDPADARNRELLKRIEERAYLGSLETKAYVEQRLRAVPSEVGRHVEERALLASQEAKAYADSAAESLGLATRAMSKVVQRLSRRMEALEQAERLSPDLEARLSAIEAQVARLHERQLAARAGALVGDFGELSRRIDDRIDGEGRQHLKRMDDALRDLAADLADVEVHWAGPDAGAGAMVGRNGGQGRQA